MSVSAALQVRVHGGADLSSQLERFTTFVAHPGTPLSRHPGWLKVCAQALGHETMLLEATDEGKTVGLLPLAHVRSLLFGRFLVSLPYLNYGGIIGEDPRAVRPLVDQAIELAQKRRVRFLELRHVAALEHEGLVARPNSKVHMRLALPSDPAVLFKSLKDKVRNLVRKGQKNPLTVRWGRHELLDPFYDVFAENMRDLGTPVFGRSLFSSILEAFPDRAELCVLDLEGVPVAGALLLHGWGVTEVPSASSLRRYNATSANMLMYWQLLERAIQRGQTVFDFGRSTPDSATFRFKKQWGAQSEEATWQYYLGTGSPGEMRPENPKYRLLIRVWQRLPIRLTRWIGPAIVRGIP